MGVIRNLRVIYKIMILVAFAMAGMLAIGLTGWSAIQQSRASLELIYKENMTQIDRIGEAKYMMRDMQSRAALAMSAHDPARFADLRGNIREIEEKFGETLQGYQSSQVRPDPAFADHVASIESRWKAFDTDIHKVVDLQAEGNEAGAAAYYARNAAKSTQALREALEGEQDLARHSAEATYQEIEMATQKAILLMIACCLTALGMLVGFSFCMARAITTPLYQMMDTCRKLGEGDFRLSEQKIIRKDEFGDMANVIVGMRNRLNELMCKSRNSAEQIAAASEELTASATQSAQASNQIAQSVTDAAGAVTGQQTAVDQSSTAVGQIVSSIEVIREQSGAASVRAGEATQYATRGMAEVDRSIGKIQSAAKDVSSSAAIVDKLGARSKEIGTIVETISGIAEQTNLLSLNAAIEAARVGEYGRGFAVVSDEVRKLAAESATAAQRIASLVSTIQKDTDEAVASMKTGRVSVEEGAQNVSALRDVFAQIQKEVEDVTRQVDVMNQSVQSADQDAVSITEQVHTINEQGIKVSDEMQTVSAATQEQSASTQEIASASASLASLAQELQESLHKFKF